MARRRQRRPRETTSIARAGMMMMTMMRPKPQRGRWRRPVRPPTRGRGQGLRAAWQANVRQVPSESKCSGRKSHRRRKLRSAFSARSAGHKPHRCGGVYRYTMSNQSGRTGGVYRYTMSKRSSCTGGVYRYTMSKRSGCTGGVYRYTMSNRSGRTGCVYRYTMAADVQPAQHLASQGRAQDPLRRLGARQQGHPYTCRP
jgi:hypothetical protein